LSGPDGHWYAEEDAALHELPLIARVMYLQGLRRFMCGQSFVVGRVRSVTYRSLAETVTVPGVRGRHSSAETVPSEKAIRYALDVLVDCGLLQRVPGCQGRLVFRCAIAAQASQARRMRGGSGAGSGAPMRGGEESSSDAGFSGMRGGMRGGPDVPMRGAHQRTDNSYSVGSTEEEAQGSRVAPTVAGALCRRLRELGVMGAQPNHPGLLEALGEGLSSQVIEDVAWELGQKGQGPPRLAHVVATARGRARDQRERGNGHAAATGGRASSERSERAVGRGDELAGRRLHGLSVVDGGRAP
jgi:hypothetical protein